MQRRHHGIPKKTRVTRHGTGRYTGRHTGRHTGRDARRTSSPKKISSEGNGGSGTMSHPSPAKEMADQGPCPTLSSPPRGVGVCVASHGKQPKRGACEGCTEKTPLPGVVHTAYLSEARRRDGTCGGAQTANRQSLPTARDRCFFALGQISRLLQ